MTDNPDMQPTVTEADRALAERLCYGMSEKAIGEAAMLISRHRSQDTARSADVGRSRFNLEWIAPPSAELPDGRRVHPNPMKGHQGFDSFDDAIAFFKRRVEGSEFVALEEVVTRKIDRTEEARAALTTPPADDGGLEDHFPSGLRSELPRTAMGIPVATMINVDCHCGWSTSATDEQEARQLWAIHARQALSRGE